MSGIGQVPLQQALNRALAAVAAVAVIASLSAMLTTGVVMLRAEARQNLELIARQASHSVEVAPALDDDGELTKALAPLFETGMLTSIVVRDARRQQLYRETCGATCPDALLGQLFAPTPVRVPVRLTGTQNGTIIVHGPTGGIGTLLTASLIGAIAALLLTFLATQLIGVGLRRTIVAPLQAIAEAAHDVRNLRSFERRAPRATITEVDELSRDFNSLLDELTDWQDQVAQAHQSLVQRANFDPLSGLSNRASFIEQVRDAIKAAQRTGDRFAILFMDGDRFKETNDRYGHAAGDIVIAEVARRLSPLLRVGDVASRVGGDEFAVLIHHLDETADAAAVALRIEEAMRAPIAVSDSDAVTIGLSIGIAIHPDHGSEVDALMSHADTSMYAAKSARRNRASARREAWPSV